MEIKKCKSCALEGNEINGCIFYDCPNKNKDGRKNNGGAGRGQGRKSPFKEPTKGVKFMCPVSKVDALKKYVNRKLLEWSKSGI